MNKTSGSFKVNLAPQDLSYTNKSGLNCGRMNIDKTFEGTLSGHSNGEMLSITAADQSAGGYVAMEVFKGSLDGREGSFALQHYGKYDSSGQSLVLEIVPGSGEGELKGITGKMNIRREDGKHFYDFEWEIVN